MKIKIHDGFVPESLTDGEKVFLAFLCVAFHNETCRTELFINTKDIRVMMGVKALTSKVRMLKFHSFYRIAQYNSEVWSFQIKDLKTHVTSGHVHWQEVELRDPKYIQMWYYLIGRMHPWDRTCVEYTGLEAVINSPAPMNWFAKEQMDFRIMGETESENEIFSS